MPTAESEIELRPQLDPRWAPSLGHVLLVALVSCTFVLLNYVPVHAPDVWASLLYGRWIIDHAALPLQDPVMPLSEGMRVVDSAWLTQTILAGAARAGEEWLANLFAVTVLIIALLLARIYFLQSSQLAVTVAVTLFVLLASGHLISLRSNLFAVLCFAALLWIVVGYRSESWTDSGTGATGRQPWRLWLGIPVVFILWANLHSSFIYGLVAVACFLAGAALEVAWKNRSLRVVASDRTVRRWLYAFELALLATLLNPYGVDLLLERLWFGRGDNLRDLSAWQPLVLLSWTGLGFAAAIVILLLALRHGRRPVPAAHALLLACGAAAVVVRQGTMTFFAFAIGVMITPQLADLYQRWRPGTQDIPSSPADSEAAAGELPPGRSWRYLLVCGLIVWMAFAFSGLSRPLLGGRARPRQQLVGPATPLPLTEHLRANPPRGIVLAPLWWSDWLAWDGPPGFQPMVTSHVQWTPRQVWQDYNHVIRGRAGWQGILDKYRINTLVMDKERQPAFVRLIRTNADWRTQYEDDQAIVFSHPATPSTSRDTKPPARDPVATDEAAAQTEPTDQQQHPSKEATGQPTTQQTDQPADQANDPPEQQP